MVIRRQRIADQITAKIAETVQEVPELWELVWGQPYIDVTRLASAIERKLQDSSTPDFRARLLVRDSLRALRQFWGPRRFAHWMARSPVREKMQEVLRENLGQTGYHAIRRRLVASLSQAQLEQVFDLLGQRLRGRIEVTIAGSVPTLLKGLTARPTDDIDFVNEVPAEIRQQRAVMDRIKVRYGLTLGHVRSHYLPTKWMDRRCQFGDFGGIRVYLVDEYDVFVSKLSSKQEKHRDDLRVMAPKLDKAKVRQRLLHDGKSFLESPFDRPTIEENWQFIYREPLFPSKEEQRRPAKEKRKGDKKLRRHNKEK